MKNLRITDMISGIKYEVIKSSLDNSIQKGNICYMSESGLMNLHVIVNLQCEITIPLKEWTYHNNEVLLKLIESEFHNTKAEITALQLKLEQMKEQL